jgi:hypothetical protein
VYGIIENLTTLPLTRPFKYITVGSSVKWNKGIPASDNALRYDGVSSVLGLSCVPAIATTDLVEDWRV